MTTDSKQLLGDLRLTLYALSLQATDALATQPEDSRRPDELALSFGEALVAALGQLPDEFTGEQVRALNDLATLLRDMSSAERAELWTEEAVHSHPQWEKVRALAREALQELGWSQHDA